MATRADAPSPLFGFRQARILWRLVLAVYVVSIGVMMPAIIVVVSAVGDALAGLPTPSLELAPGEALLIAVNALKPVLKHLLVLAGVGVLMNWLWTVLWHAGSVQWLTWNNVVPVRVGHVVGLGVLTFGKYFRLSLWALVSLVSSVAMVWMSLAIVGATGQAYMTELMEIVMAGIGVFAMLILALVWVATTMRAAWRLGEADSPGAVRAWIGAAVTTLRCPWQSFKPLVTLGLAVVVCGMAPLVIGFMWSVGAGGPIGVLVEVLSGLAQAHCSVALFLAFAPVSKAVIVDRGGDVDEEKAASD